MFRPMSSPEKKANSSSSLMNRVGAADQAWFDQTTICGLVHTRDADTLLESAVWMVVFVAAAVFQDYYRYEVQTNVAVKHDHAVSKYCIIVMSSSVWPLEIEKYIWRMVVH